jgi:hypothetical protein
MPVCVPRSLPGFVDTVTTVAGRGSPADWPAAPASEIPYLVGSPLLWQALALGPSDKASSRANRIPVAHP